MSYSMGSIDCIAIKIDESYLEALKKDIEQFGNDAKFIIKNQDQLILYENQYNDFQDDKEIFNDIDSYCQDLFDCGIRYYDGGKGSENYAYQRPLDLNKGTLGEADNFDGYVYEFSWGSSSIYKPEFESKEDFIAKLKKELYIPSSWDLEDNVIFLTGVWGG